MSDLWGQPDLSESKAGELHDGMFLPASVTFTARDSVCQQETLFALLSITFFPFRFFPCADLLEPLEKSGTGGFSGG